jgi:hypothetical protein
MVIFAGVVSANNGLFRAPKGHDDNGHKINGKHPQRRLQALNKFLCGWFKSNAGDDGLMSEAKAQRMCDRVTTQVHHYNQIFLDKECAYFDPSVKFGGPNPDPSMKGMRQAKNPNAKNPFVQRAIDRFRREDDADYDEDDYDEEDYEALEECDGTETGALAAFCTEDNVARKSKLSPQQRKLKRFTKSTAKWCSRYISECYGQRVHEHCVNRSIKLYNLFKN